MCSRVEVPKPGSGAEVRVEATCGPRALPSEYALGAGSFEAYERAHREAVTRTLSPKLALPPELVRTVVEFYLHAGFYPFTEVPATAPTATA